MYVYVLSHRPQVRMILHLFSLKVTPNENHGTFCSILSKKTHYIITVALNHKLRHCCSRLQFLVKPGWCSLFYSHLDRYKQPECNLSLSLLTTTDGNCFLGNCLGGGLLISHSAEVTEDGTEGEEVTFIAEQEGKVGTQENHQVSEWQNIH